MRRFKEYLMEMDTSLASTQQNAQQTDAPKTKDSPTEIEEPLFNNPNVWENKPPIGDSHEPGMEHYKTFEEWYIAWIYWWMNYGGGIVGPNRYDLEKLNQNDLEQIRQYLRKIWQERFQDRRKRPQYGPPPMPFEWQFNGPRYT